MRLVGPDHVRLAMPPGGEADARRFHADALGSREVAKPPDLAARGGRWFEGGGGRGLRVHLGVEEDFRPARKAHPAFTVRGLRDLAAELRARGSEPVVDKPLEGLERLCANDPFGNRIEPVAPPAGRPRQIPA